LLGSIRFILAALVVPMQAAFEVNYRSAHFAERTTRFFRNRALRIFPTYWIALGLAVYFKWGGWEVEYILRKPAAALQNVVLLGLNQAEIWGKDVRLIGPAWSLDVEIQYYLLSPLLAQAWHEQRC
jgi:peptidoglycan/LPS O-acetylase OafA/YrhL